MNLGTRPTAEDIKGMLGLEPHPTRGFVAETYRSPLKIPAGTFHTSRLEAGASYALLASTEWPGVEPPGVEHGDIEALMRDFPDFREEIQAFTRKQ